MTRAESIEELSKLIPDCEKCPLIVANCKKQGHYDGCMKQREAVKMAIEALSVDIIRCKDCAYGEIDNPEFPNQYFCHFNGQAWNDGEHFCSDGYLPEIMTPPTGEINEKEK